MDPAVIGALGVTGGVLGLVSWGLWERHQLQVSHYRLTHPRWPRRLGRWRIVHLTDLHVVRRGRYLEGVLGAVQEARPDIILLTGDLVDDRQGIEPFLQAGVHLQAPAGVWAVYGNREMRTGFPRADFADRLGRAGIRVLRNQAAPAAGSEGAVWVVGIEIPAVTTLYLESARREREGARPPAGWKTLWLEQVAAGSQAAFEEVDARAFRLVLVHTPDMLPSVLERRPELVLAGHTHGGQVRLLRGAPLTHHLWHVPRDWFSGWRTLDATQLMVARGIGTSNLPLRIGCPPELVVLDLQWGSHHACDTSE